MPGRRADFMSAAPGRGGVVSGPASGGADQLVRVRERDRQRLTADLDPIGIEDLWRFELQCIKAHRRAQPAICPGLREGLRRILCGQFARGGGRAAVVIPVGGGVPRLDPHDHLAIRQAADRHQRLHRAIERLRPPVAHQNRGVGGQKQRLLGPVMPQRALTDADHRAPGQPGTDLPQDLHARAGDDPITGIEKFDRDRPVEGHDAAACRNAARADQL